MSLFSTKYIVVPACTQLRKESYKRRLWIAIVNLPHSRRGLRDDIVCAFRDNPKKLVHSNGLPYTLPDIDDVFGDDPDFRWLSYYKKANAAGDGQEHPCRSYERLEILAIYCLIRYPDIARHFDR